MDIMPWQEEVVVTVGDDGMRADGLSSERKKVIKIVETRVKVSRDQGR